MAQTYRICVSGVATDTTIDWTIPAASQSRYYTDGDGCSVYEVTKDIVVTSTLPSDDSFMIFYNYTITYSVNGVEEGVPLVRGRWVTMQAGATTATIIDALVSVQTTCTTDDGGGGGHVLLDDGDGLSQYEALP